MNLDKAVEIVLSYLPDDFLKYYNLNSAYSYEENGATIYTYDCSLSEEGLKYSVNNKEKQYMSDYFFRIYHFKDTNQWKIETGYYGRKDSEWIQKNAKKWDIDLSKYSQNPK